MTRTLPYFIVCILLGGQSLSAQITLPDTVQTLAGAIRVLTETHELNFTYRPEEIANLPVRTPRRALSPNELLLQLLEPHYLKFDHNGPQNFVLYRSQELIDLKGNVRSDTEPLIAATVQTGTNGTGTNTDLNGNFQLHLSPFDTIIVSYLGYETRQLPPAEWRDRRQLLIELKPDAVLMDAVIITSEYLVPGIQLNESGTTVEVDLEQTGPLPGRADVDVLHTLRYVPGVSMTSGASSSWSVRGSTSGQNLLTYGGIPVYHTGHYFGLIASLDGSMTNQMRVERGDRAARSGERVGGVVELDTEPSTENEFSASLNLLHAGLRGNWRSRSKYPTRVTASLRSSYGGIWRSPAYRAITRRAQQGELLQVPSGDRLPPGFLLSDRFGFRDGMLKLTQQSPVGTFRVNAFGGTNDFESAIRNVNGQRTQLDTLDLKHGGWSVGWQETFGRLTLDAQVYVSRYQYKYNYLFADERNPNFNQNGHKFNDLDERGVDLRATVARFQFGYQNNRYRTDYGLLRLDPNSPTTQVGDQLTAYAHALYTEYESDPAKALGFRTGARLVHYSPTKDWFVLPRLYLRWDYAPRGRFFASAGGYRQFISRLIDFAGDPAGIETPLWIPAGAPDIPILRADQASIGWQYQAPNTTLEVQTYARRVRGITSNADDFESGLAAPLLKGDAYVSGVDALAKFRFGNWRTWLAYSYTRARYEFPRFFDTEFEPQHVRPHNLQLTLLWRRHDWQISGSGQYLDGISYTDRMDLRPRQLDNGTFVLMPQGTEFNNNRLPGTWRFDAALQYRWQAARWRGTVGLSYYNLLGSVNFYERRFFLQMQPTMNPEPPNVRYLDRADLSGLLGLSLRIDLGKYSPMVSK